MRTREMYDLTCWRCNTDLRIACRPPFRCSNCGMFLNLRWRVTTIAATSLQVKADSRLIARMVKKERPGKYLDATHMQAEGVEA